MSNIPGLDLARKSLVAYLTQRYETQWFHEHERCSLTTLAHLAQLQSRSSLAAALLVIHLRDDGIRKGDAYALLELLMGKKVYRLKRWKVLVNRVYSRELDDQLMDKLLSQASDVLATVGDSRFDGVPVSAMQVYQAAVRLSNQPGIFGMLPTTAAKLAEEARVSIESAKRALKLLAERGVIRWYPGHKSSPSLLEIVPLE